MPPYSAPTSEILERLRRVSVPYLRLPYTPLLLSFISCGILGCFSTTLPALDAPPELTRLERLSDTPVTLRVEVPDELATSPVGLQYALGILPVTRVYTPELAHSVSNLVRLEAGLRGVSGTPSNDTTHCSTPSAPTLTVVVDDVSINGYDLFVLRRPSATVTLTGYFTRTRRGAAPLEDVEERTQQCSAQADESFSSSYAFEAELNEALRRAIIRAAGMVLDCLGKPSR